MLFYQSLKPTHPRISSTLRSLTFSALFGQSVVLLLQKIVISSTSLLCKFLRLFCQQTFMTTTLTWAVCNLTLGKKESKLMSHQQIKSSNQFSFQPWTPPDIHGCSTASSQTKSQSCSAVILVLQRLSQYSVPSVSLTLTSTFSLMWTFLPEQLQRISKISLKKILTNVLLSHMDQSLLARRWFSLLMTWTCQ